MEIRSHSLNQTFRLVRDNVCGQAEFICSLRCDLIQTNHADARKHSTEIVRIENRREVSYV